MEFAKYFPTFAWFWRRLTSRLARRTALYFLLALTVLSVGLRVNSAIFVHRVHTIVAGMEQLKPERTTKAEMLKMVPALRHRPLEYSGHYDQCEEDECYSVRIQNVEALSKSNLFQVVYRFTVRALPYLGVHLWDFSAKVEVRKERVHSFYYVLEIDNCDARSRGAMRFGARSVLGPISRREVGELFLDESPDYGIVWNQWLVPSFTLFVHFRPTAPPELVHHAFDLQLGCMMLFGCRTTRQVMPLVWDDHQRIIAAALSRMEGPDPCPDRILVRRARDVTHIILAEVAGVRQGPGYTLADYHLLEVLKGGATPRLNGLMHFPEIPRPSWADVPNPAFKLLKPGTRVLMFIDRYGTLVEPCEIVPATPGALQTIRDALASPTSQAVESGVAQR